MAKANPHPMSSRRRWLFRCGAVLVGLSLFVLIEVACRILDVGQPQRMDDPFVGFSTLQPLFELDESKSRYAIPMPRLKFFAGESFPARKAAGTYRIFCLGGSTVQGRPFSKETSFTTFLKLGLSEADSSRDWEVINCGGISYASYRLVPILEECLSYEPDLFILCTGHNEFLEDRSYGHIRDVAPLAVMPLRSLSGLRSYHAFRNLLRPLLAGSEAAAPETWLGPDVAARLDFQNGLAAYERDDQWQAGVMRHFEFNIRRMMQTARQHEVPLLLILPPSNLADTPPFKSSPRDGLRPDEQTRHGELIEKARRQQTTDPYGAVDTLRESLGVDDRQADVHYQVGRLLESLGETVQARESFVTARDNDICPLRIVSPMESALRSAVSNWHVPFLDAHGLLEARTGNGILGNAWLLDHVHPTIDGHEQIALALIQSLADQQIASPQSNWRVTASEAFRRHRKSLPPVYYLKGEQRLENLRYWTRGMAEGKDPE